MERTAQVLKIAVSLSIVAALVYLVWKAHSWTRAQSFPDAIEVEQ